MFSEKVYRLGISGPLSSANGDTARRTVMELGDLSQVSVHLVATLVSCTTATRLSLSYPSSAISSHASFDPSGENVKPDTAPWS